jgi:hypothetical protein
MTTAIPSSGTIKLPAQFAILISDPVPASPFSVQLEGLRGGSVVTSDTETVTLTGTHGSLKFTLNEGSSGGDGGAGADMAVMNPPVVTGLDPVTVDELAALSIDLSATDPLGGNVVLSASNLPGNAVFTPTGATGKLTWTPSYTEAGTYTVKITATPDDTSRAATFDLVVTVKNAADLISIGGNPITTAVPIGDWDKDGFGDLAVCTGDAAGATGKYHVQILYGAATGLPLDAAGAAGRVDSFDIDALTLGGTLYSCQGGDFDGDGHADIIFADPANDYWGAGSKQGKFTVIFGGARGAAPPSIYLAGNQNFGQHMGETFAVGDFNGDGKSDILTTWAVNADTAVIFVGGARVNAMTGAFGEDYPDQNSPCAPVVTLLMIDLNKDGLADWVAQTPQMNVGTAVASCSGAELTGGGLRIVPGRSSGNLLDPATTTTFSEYYAPTSAANSRYAWGRQAAGCDVDHDGYNDIGLLHTWPAMTTQHGEVYYGSAAGLVATAKMPLGDTVDNSFTVNAMQPASIGCAPSYKNGHAAVVVSATDTANATGRIEFYGDRPLVKLGEMNSPSGGEMRFGSTISSGNHTDVDGDGHEDILVTSNTNGWVIYGR